MISNPITKPKEVYFSGLPKEIKAKLNAWAKASGYKVRSGVTKNLTYLFLGPFYDNPSRKGFGKSKLEKAKNIQGCKIRKLSSCDTFEDWLSFIENLGDS